MKKMAIVHNIQLFGFTNPYYGLVNIMARELEIHMKRASQVDFACYDMAGYEQEIKDFTRALVNISRLEQNWH